MESRCQRTTYAVLTAEHLSPLVQMEPNESLGKTIARCAVRAGGRVLKGLGSITVELGKQVVVAALTEVAMGCVAKMGKAVVKKWNKR